MRLTIEKLIYGGDGLARVPGEGDDRRGKTVFIPFVLAGEVVEGKTVEERKGFTRARLLEVLEPSPERVEAPCPHFGRCGGCQYQHSSYAAQLESKRQILRETVFRGARLELPEITVHSAEPLGYRNRTRMKLQTQPEFAVGYFRQGSHVLEEVHECPISSPLINRALAALWAVASQAPVDPSLREVQFFANHDDSQLLVELFVHHWTAPASLAPFARALRERMPEIAGVAIFAGGALEAEGEEGSLESSRQLSRAGTPHVEGSRYIKYRVGEVDYRVSAGSFFQTNRFLAEKLVKLATDGREGQAALDLFAGVGLFTLPLAGRFEKVTAVEIGDSSSLDLALNVAERRVRTMQNTTDAFLAELKGRWDYVVADPPRAGLGERVVRSLARLRVPRMTYVSCDPATLSRDLMGLAAAGYRVEAAHLVDLFPQTYHMETVLHLAL